MVNTNTLWKGREEQYFFWVKAPPINFTINLVDRKKNGTTRGKRVQTFFRIELRQNYHRDVSEKQGGISGFSLSAEPAFLLTGKSVH